MGFEVVVNVVYVKKIVELFKEERVLFISSKWEEYKEDINIYCLVLEMIIDVVILVNLLCDELVKWFKVYMIKEMIFINWKYLVYFV